MQEGEGSIQVEWFSKHRQRNQGGGETGDGRSGGTGLQAGDIGETKLSRKEWQFSDN